MGINDTIYTLSNVNAILGSLNGYRADKNNGVNTADAFGNMSYNMMNGILRNAASKEILNSTGSYLGYAINSAAGYGSAEANQKGTMGTIGAAMLSSPFGIFGCNPYFSTLYGCGPFGGNYWNGGIFGGGLFGCGNFGGGCCGPSMFSNRGLWC